MDTRNWRNYAELVGLFAIVFSIVLLAFEIHQTRLAIKGDAYMSRAIIGAELDMEIANSDYLPAIFIKHKTEGVDSLTPIERNRLMNSLFSAKTRMDAYFYQYELGLLPEEFFKFFISPNIRFYKKGWLELDLVNETDTRPSFMALINESVANDDEWDF